MISRGLLIVFEGADRSGKTTQAKLLFEALNAQGLKCEALRFPDRTTDIGVMINRYLSKKQRVEDHVIHLLFSANRWERSNYIKEKLLSGTSLILDRYAYSGVVYTASKGYELSYCMAPDSGLPKPDLIFYLKTSYEELRVREDYGKEIYEKTSFQTKVLQTYDKFSQNLKSHDHNWIEIDSTKSVEITQEKIFKKSLELLAKPRTELQYLW